MLLLIGFLTPLAAVSFGLGALAISVAGISAPGVSLFQDRLSIVLSGIITAAVVFLGPGGFSIDARLFGPREVIIPVVRRNERQH